MVKSSGNYPNLGNSGSYDAKIIDGVPSFIFSNEKYTILESVIVYLREIKGLSFHVISELIKRHVRDVYNAYQNAKKKELDTRYYAISSDVRIPLSVFARRDLSPFESVVSYLKDELSLTYHRIAVLLNRDDRTIWTVYSRARKKNAKKE